MMMPTPRRVLLDRREFHEVDRERAAREARWAEGNVDHVIVCGGFPSPVAGREVGSWVMPLKLLSGLAILFGEMYVVPRRHEYGPPSRSESYWIAAIGFVLSTAWWMTVGTVIPWIHQASTRRHQKRI
jgi:hypothetical protein